MNNTPRINEPIRAAAPPPSPPSLAEALRLLRLDAERLVQAFPIASVAAALAAGVLVGWMTKRR